MNKIIVRGFFFFILIGLLLIFIFRNRSPFGSNNSSFATVPKEEITRIEFSSGNRRLSLEKKDDTWLINGKTEARKNGILYIVRILEEIKIKSPVSSELFESEVTDKNITPVKVRVFEKNRLLKSFLVYRTGSNIYGNIMKIREGSKPFIVYVPGYDGNIGSGFEPDELFWQPYTVFNLLPSEISSVEFENLSDTSSSFSITNRYNHFSLSGNSAVTAGWDTTLVVRYISYFAWVPFESWALDITNEEKKLIEASQPLYRITVNKTSGKKSTLTLWQKKADRNGIQEIDSDRILGKTDDRNALFIMRYFDIDPLIKKRSYFFPQ
jgi:hypothetical protein